MTPVEVDMTAPGPDPVHEAAYSRIRRLIVANKALLDSYAAYTPAQLAGNWKVALIKKHKDMVALRGLWGRDVEFRGYLRERLTFHFGAVFTDKLIRVFLG